MMWFCHDTVYASVNNYWLCICGQGVQLLFIYCADYIIQIMQVQENSKNTQICFTAIFCYPSLTLNGSFTITFG